MLITKSLNSTQITSSNTLLLEVHFHPHQGQVRFQEASNSIRMARWSRIIITIIIMDIRGTNMGMGVWVWAWGIIIMAMGDMRAGDMDMDMDIIMGMGMEVSMDGMG